MAAGANVLILSDRDVSPELAPDPVAAGDRRRAPPSDPRGHPHPLRPGRRDRRGARGLALRAADRVRRGRDQPLPRLRDDRPAGRRGDLRPRGPRLREGRQELPEGHRQGPAQDLREDGDLDAAQLSRRADLRGDRARSRVHRPLLHRNPVARLRRRRRRDRARDADALRPRLRAGRLRRTPSWIRAVSTSGASAASGTRSTPRRSPSSSTRCAARASPPSRSTRRPPTTTPSGSAPCAGS